MKQTTIICSAVLLTLLILAGCSKEATTAPTTTLPAATPTTQSAAILNTPVPTEIPSTESPMDPKISSVLANQKKIISYTYIASGAQYDVGTDDAPETWWVKGNLAKIKIHLLDTIPKDQYDTVYVNFETQRAETYCEDLSRCSDTETPSSIAYTTHLRTTPLEWAKEIPNNAEFLRTEYYESKEMTVLRFAKDGATYTMWASNFYGVPHKVVVETESGKTTYEFRDMIYNQVKDTDVTHQRIAKK
jgi:hypothetical protein